MSFPRLVTEAACSPAEVDPPRSSKVVAGRPVNAAPSIATARERGAFPVILSGARCPFLLVIPSVVFLFGHPEQSEMPFSFGHPEQGVSLRSS
ncbi:hypothetical protein [Bifidobacterium moraviense]|uniref:hypothetical protein n=1 Tax=Bifidobacterium moraviense TaxID=2675323 RepID=UPI00145C7E44|nr:hypothetical protein [Bifidobacterium sp. DSM 109958]